MGELARKFGGPKLPESPMELITPRPGEGFKLRERWFYPVGGLTVGLTNWLLYNLVAKRPWWASVPFHAITTAGIVYGFILLRDLRFDMQQEEDAVIKHYITLHPEDFPPYARKRFGEIYLPFKPVR